MTTISDVFPALGLRIVTESVELRGIVDDDLVTLGELARAGVHDPDFMPFDHPWTDAPADQQQLNMAQYHWRCRASFGPDNWNLDLGVWHEGVLVGTQGLAATDFAITRTAVTGSWLGRAHHGRGIGTAMRRAVCAFAFDHLGATSVASAAFEDNAASLAVSRKVGYRENGTSIMSRRGQAARQVRLLLTPEALRRPDSIEVTGVAAFRASIGL